MTEKGDYIVAPGPDGSSSFVIHRPTGRTISQFTDEQHAERAERAARALEVQNTSAESLRSNTFSVTL